jgi:hypothetical protein
MLVFSITAHHHFSVLIFKDKEPVFVEEIQLILGLAIEVEKVHQQRVCLSGGNGKNKIVCVFYVVFGQDLSQEDH